MRMIIMTESSKFGGRCVAGINIENGEWVRLVTDDEDTHGAVSPSNLMTADNKMCRILDVVDVPIIKKCGNSIQPENVLMDTSKHITKVRKASIKEVLQIHPAEQHTYVLGNPYSFLSEQMVHNVGHSLTLVDVDDLVINQVTTPEGKNKTKASFKYNGIEYNHVSVTDPTLYSSEDGTEIGKAILVVSIGTPYNSKYYKFVSGVYIQ